MVNDKIELKEVAKAAAPAFVKPVSPDSQSIAPAKKDRKVPVRNSRRPGVFIPRDYMEAFPGDHATYTLLSQLMYWRMPNDDGKSRLRVQDGEGNFVIAKNAAELFEETRLTRGQIDSAKAKLKVAGILNAVSGARDAAKTTFYTFVHFPGNSRLDDYPTIDELKGIACTAATQCMPTCNASHAHMHSNTESVPQTVSKTKEYKHEFPSGHSGTTGLEQHQEQPGNSEPQNQPASLVELVESPKKYKGEKPGPKPAPADMGSGDWDSYFRLAKTHDMDGLLACCKKVEPGFVKGSGLLAECDCSMLERVEYYLAGLTEEWSSLEAFLTWLAGGEGSGEGYEHERWMSICACMEYVTDVDLHCPPRPKLAFLVAHFPKLLTYLQWSNEAEQGLYGPPKPAKAAAALESGPAVPLPEASPCAGIAAPASPPVAPDFEYANEPMTGFPMMLFGDELKAAVLESEWTEPWKPKSKLKAAVGATTHYLPSLVFAL